MEYRIFGSDDREPENFRNSQKIRELMLSKKFRQYFLPSVITAVALSLSEFVGGMIVSNLLDAQALAVINVSMPIMTLMSTVFMLFGGSGAIIYSEYLGQRDEKSAAEVFGTTLAATVLMSLVITGISLLALDPLVNLLCPGGVLGPDLNAYVFVLLLSFPVLTTISFVFMFLPVAGSPNLTMVLNIAANVMNLILDVIYIRFFHMSVAGAALSTLTSFSAAGLTVLILLPKTRLRAAKPVLSHLLPAAGKGAGASLTQIGYTVKFGFCNMMVTLYGGASGLIAMSLCFQSISIISIILTGCNDTIRPLLSFLRSQEDCRGVRFILLRTIWVAEIVSLLFSLFLILFPNAITFMFNVSDPEVLRVACTSLRLFSIMYPLRSIVVLYMLCTSILGLTGYSAFMSLFDGVAGFVPIGLILSRFSESTGSSFPFRRTAFCWSSSWC